MPSLLPVLLHDCDLPETVRADLVIYESSPRDGRGWAARRRVATGLRAAFDLDDGEITALLAFDGDGVLPAVRGLSHPRVGARDTPKMTAT